MYLKIKRIVDFVVSMLMVVLLLPLFIVLYVAMKLDSSGPVFFKQKRFGNHKVYFNILKYRTMKVDAPRDIPTHLLENPEQYITRVGKFLRRSSLDELPQLFNIIAGDMSFVGPRPALWNQEDLVEERDKYGANDVPVGLTGWAQVNGRDELPIAVKAKLDGEYVKRASLAFDMRCLFKTFVVVGSAEGYAEGTTSEFDK